MDRDGNILVVILSVIALVSLSATGYLWWQNQQLQKSKVEIVAPTPAPVVKDETVNWKTYRDDKGGYEFKSPVEIVFDKARSGGNITQFNTFDGNIGITQVVVLDKADAGYSELSKIFGVAVGGSVILPKQSKFTKIKKEIIDGVDAVRFLEIPSDDAEGMLGWENEGAVVIKDNRLYVIRHFLACETETCVKKSGTNLGLFNKSLQTFRFLE